MTRTMHGDEVDTDVALVARLVAGQFPQWSAQSRSCSSHSSGTDHTIYRSATTCTCGCPGSRAPPARSTASSNGCRSSRSARRDSGPDRQGRRRRRGIRSSGRCTRGCRCTTFGPTLIDDASGVASDVAHFVAGSSGSNRPAGRDRPVVRGDELPAERSRSTSVCTPTSFDVPDTGVPRLANAGSRHACAAWDRAPRLRSTTTCWPAGCGRRRAGSRPSSTGADSSSDPAARDAGVGGPRRQARFGEASNFVIGPPGVRGRAGGVVVLTRHGRDPAWRGRPQQIDEVLAEHVPAITRRSEFAEPTRRGWR